MSSDIKTKLGKVLVFKGALKTPDKTIQIEIPKEEKDGNALDLLWYLKGVKKAFVFSAHLDDAMLSTASLVAYLVKSEVDVSVITAFTEGSTVDAPLTRKLIRQGGLTNATEYFSMRKIEDRKAISLLGNIQTKHLGFIDSAWRHTNKGKPLYPLTTIGIERHIQDTVFLQLEKRLRELKQQAGNAVVFGPIGWGRHIDHVLVRDALIRVFPNAIFYADFPYTRKYDTEDEFVKKHQRKPIIWKAQNYSLKAKAVAMYRTQIVSMFGDKGYMRLGHETFYVKLEILPQK